MNSIQLTHFDHYSLLTIIRGKSLNALNAEVFQEIDSVISSPFPASTRLLVVTGEGEKAFAAGADITEFSGLTGDEAEQLSLRGQKIFDKFQKLNFPTVALIHGFALGGGLELALACHIRVVTKTAVLGLPELNLGLIPGYGGTQRLPQLIGKGKAIYYLLGSENMNADQALESGLADFLVDDKESGFAFAEKFASRLSTKSKLSSTLALEAINKSGIDGGYEKEAFNFKKAFETDDMKEGVTAFLEKRKPQFQHR
jgi:enoyl-CoA hydratase